MVKRKKLIVFPFIQKMEGCDAREVLNIDSIPSDSDKTVETEVNVFVECAKCCIQL